MDRIEISNIKVGMRYSKPIFFDDGKNMFIESGVSIKPHHMAALTKWKIPFLLSDGRLLGEGETAEEELPALDEIEDLDELEEL
ncbi:MAG: phosphohydrolase [Treponema sp.]|nr:phosphohydrolase [Treponema sp.]